MATAIEFNNISKQYRLGLVSTRTLSHDLNRWWTVNVRGKEDPYLKIGETNDRSHKGESEYVWALKDIDFKVEQGDVVGIIGKNGAGKSTLLKILSKVTGPTTGTIKARGRIGSLLEVGTGFHPEMTGRENIFLNGAILGMTKTEISQKLDEIVDFSGCERYIDTPVKRYSSGMTVRLGFAVAAFLEPEILVVDEVLAVGDAEFQKKAIGKMQDVSQGEGRTVLFVSHNMASIRSLCSRGVLLENGAVRNIGGIDSIVSEYLAGDNESRKSQIDLRNYKRDNDLLQELSLQSISIENPEPFGMASDEPLMLAIVVKVNDHSIKNYTISFSINNCEEIRVGTYISPLLEVPEGKDEFVIKITLPGHNLTRGSYSMCFNIGIKDIETGLRDFDVIHRVVDFDVVYATKGKVLALWQKSWGDCYYQDAQIEVI